MSKNNRESHSSVYVPERVCHAVDELLTAAMTGEAAVRYWFRKLEGHDFFEYPDAEKPLELHEYLWKYHQLPAGAAPTKKQLVQYARYLSSLSKELPCLWRPLFDYLAARHQLSESQVKAMTLGEIATLLRQDCSNQERDAEEAKGKYPLGLILLPDRRFAKRNDRTVEFRGRNVVWNMLVLLCERYPAYYPAADLGHRACNEGWKREDAGLNTLYVHISEATEDVFPARRAEPAVGKDDLFTC
jgi:hypothetical protein